MRFSCSRNALNDVLGLLSGIVPPRSSKPVLQNILLQGQEDGSLLLSATDLEIGIRYRLEVEELTDPEDVLLPAARFHGLVRDDWSERVTVEIRDQRAEIATDHGTFHLVGAEADDFPPIQSIDAEAAVELPGEDVVDAVEKTIFAAAKGDVRYALNGVLLHLEGGNAEFVASDTHRLSLVKKKLRAEAPSTAEAIVIGKGMQELARLAREAELVRIQLTSHEMIAETPSASLVARLVDGQFPRYREVIPQQVDNRVTLERETLMKSLRLVGQMTHEESHSVRIAAQGGKALLSATGSEVGDARVEVDAELEGEDLEVAFNYIYLLDVLKVLKDDSVTIQLRDNETPARIDVGEFLHIIMPIRPGLQ